MKKIFLSITLLSALFISSNLHAQGVGVGIRAGVNFANQSIGDISQDSKTGFLGGAYVILAFSEKWAIQPEILYSAQGSELSDIGGVNDFSYLSIPVLLRWKPINVLSIEAGPQFSQLLDATNDGGSVKEQFKNSDFGLVVGATIHLPLGLNAGVRYVWGFTNVSDVQNSQEVKNTTAQIFAGWTIFGAK